MLYYFLTLMLVASSIAGTPPQGIDALFHHTTVSPHYGMDLTANIEVLDRNRKCLDLIYSEKHQGYIPSKSSIVMQISSPAPVDSDRQEKQENQGENQTQSELSMDDTKQQREETHVPPDDSNCPEELLFCRFCGGEENDKCKGLEDHSFLFKGCDCMSDAVVATLNGAYRPFETVEDQEAFVRETMPRGWSELSDDMEQRETQTQFTQEPTVTDDSTQQNAAFVPNDDPNCPEELLFCDWCGGEENGKCKGLEDHNWLFKGCDCLKETSKGKLRRARTMKSRKRWTGMM